MIANTSWTKYTVLLSSYLGLGLEAPRDQCYPVLVLVLQVEPTSFTYMQQPEFVCECDWWLCYISAAFDCLTCELCF